MLSGWYGVVESCEWLVWCCRNQGIWRLVAGHALLTDTVFAAGC